MCGGTGRLAIKPYSIINAEQTGAEAAGKLVVIQMNPSLRVLQWSDIL